MARSFREIVEGFTQGVGNQIRGFFAAAPEVQSAQLRRGGLPSSERAGLSYNLASQFGYDSLAQHLRVDQDLQARYTDYEEMDEYPEISTALDIYSDDTTMPRLDGTGQSVWVNSEDTGTAKELNEMLHKRVLIDNDGWGGARTLCKYGNWFGETLVSEQGVIGLNYLPPPTVRRVEGPRGELLGFVQDTKGEFNISLEDFYKLAQQRGTNAERNRAPGELTVFEDWEVIHWRLRGKSLRSTYGHGVIDPARWIWKRLALLEDALLIYKLSRAPSRYAFYVDIGELDGDRGLAYVNRVKNQFVKRRFVNPSTGKLDMRYNPLAHDEDFFVPTRQGKDSTRIEVLQGPDYAETDSLEYHRDKLVAALKIPKMYMGYGGEATKGALSSEDIRFARTVMRIQKEMRIGLRKVCRVHLIARGAENPDAHDYDVQMTVPSAILELAKLEVMSATADLADRMGERVSTKYILTTLFKFTEGEAVKLMKERDKEQIQKAELEAKVQQIIAGGMEQAGGGEEQGVEPEPQLTQFDHVQNRRTDPILERRFEKVVRLHHGKWERAFNRRMDSVARVEAKLEVLLKENPKVLRRMERLEGLLMDVRGSMRRAA